MKQNKRQSDRLDWRGSWALFRLAFWVLAFVAVFLAVLILWDHRESVNRSISARLSLLERKVEQKSRPVIHIQRATVYNADGEVAVRTIETGKKK